MTLQEIKELPIIKDWQELFEGCDNENITYFNVYELPIYKGKVFLDVALRPLLIEYRIEGIRIHNKTEKEIESILAEIDTRFNSLHNVIEK